MIFFFHNLDIFSNNQDFTYFLLIYPKSLANLIRLLYSQCSRDLIFQIIEQVKTKSGGSSTEHAKNFRRNVKNLKSHEKVISKSLNKDQPTKQEVDDEQVLKNLSSDKHSKRT